ncbi:NAD(P)H-dependent oxidoreductase [Flavobacterium sp. CS20]|jgi:nitroreductase|uniref:NAD(P)H-dependent oxidoreductase n=1 Tax=Flavobacterium sp. CS20 TaxID=2775246 RepID=UPI001B3A07C0|nr:NAD(P)H-dependent oxidoreductase [Flavobacterium sp. CS20]QTY28256.1 NAD(P)H-dependent oxidoreductase [Flavobacterium sp. CS20]
MTTHDYIQKLNFRYATKLFNPEKKLNDEQINNVKKAIQLSASSYGLQPYEVLIIEDIDLRKKLKSASWNQPQITDASHLIVFCANTNVDDQYLDRYIKNIAQTRNIDESDLSGMRDMLANTVLKLDDESRIIWAQKQAYIALGNLLSAVAHFGFDACPMEGFDNEKYDDILDLKSKNLRATVIATLGYRSEDDQLQHAKKVRKSQNELFTEY